MEDASEERVMVLWLSGFGFTNCLSLKQRKQYDLGLPCLS